jgi:hypothetical protein
VAAGEDTVTDPAVLLALADRCEREEPSVDLDADIWWALFPDAEPTSWPDYTTSLDAAVTLVPEGWSTTVRVALGLMVVATVWRSSGECFDGTAKTEAAARVAAALRALSQTRSP